ncbi:hypothetical protein J4T99_gp051 [Mycobacterium phage Bromden]|uniref:Uncharacterized protein n=1 Tax=Mycobacterium phage Bromden TaxID=2283252 RepID=A0A345MBI6_9CAUD|nr:hypothetical protein J4T99_gp051 [Mycobacterium phage Bromden]AXH67857.1 hypothetical protein SEA_BROMDEN_51 [Mycobacterium phage Bromden]
MSKKSLFKQPGIEQLLPGHDLPVGVKVTGRNMHAVTLLVSASGEANGSRSTATAFFESDGSLSHVKLTDNTGSVDVKAGEYLVLSDDLKTVVVAGTEDYEFLKVLLPLLVAVDTAFDSLAESLGGLDLSNVSGLFGL